MHAARIAAYFLLGIAALLVGLFVLVGSALPAERDFVGEKTLCHKKDVVHEALSDTRIVARWMLPEFDHRKTDGDRLRWQDVSDGRWMELRIIDSNPDAVSYEMERQDRFTIPIDARLESISGKETGTRVHVTAHANAETVVGRWFLVSPDILGWLGLRHQSFDEAVKTILEPLDEHLGPTEC